MAFRNVYCVEVWSGSTWVESAWFDDADSAFDMVDELLANGHQALVTRRRSHESKSTD